jgi:hypothetical protein
MRRDPEAYHYSRVGTAVVSTIEAAMLFGGITLIGVCGPKFGEHVAEGIMIYRQSPAEYDAEHAAADPSFQAEVDGYRLQDAEVGDRMIWGFINGCALGGGIWLASAQLRWERKARIARRQWAQQETRTDVDTVEAIRRQIITSNRQRRA